MPGINLDVGGDPAAFGERVGVNRVPVIHTTADWSLASLPNGMSSGRTSLVLAIPVDVAGNRALILAETSLAAWMMAATALRAAHEEEVDQPGYAVLSDDARALILPRYAEAVRRVLGSDVDQARADELAEMLLDALSAGAPTEEGG